MTVSVAMATYNGERYLKEQLDSILAQITEDDEIIISDDGSVDDTIDILNDYIKKYSNIKIIKGPQKGFVRNFENALLACTKDIVFLCDQDDIWAKDKVYKVKRAFEDKDIHVVAHMQYFIDKAGKKMCGHQKSYSLRHGLWLNMLYSSYTGCCMAVRTIFLKRILPFPQEILTHDQWIGLMGEREKNVKFLKDALTGRRIHGDNVSKRLGLMGKICFRIKTMRCYYRWKRGKR